MRETGTHYSNPLYQGAQDKRFYLKKKKRKPVHGSWPDRANSLVLTRQQLRLSVPEGLHAQKRHRSYTSRKHRRSAPSPSPRSTPAPRPDCSITAHPMTCPIRPLCCRPGVATGAPGSRAGRQTEVVRVPGVGASHVGRLAPPTPASALTWRHAGPMKHLQGRGRAPGVWEDL